MESKNRCLSAVPLPDSREAEQAHLTKVYDLAEQERATTVKKLQRVMAESGGTPQARSERESYNALFTSQIRHIDEAQAGLCFGRIDLVPDSPLFSDTDDDTENPQSPEVTCYIGRLGLLDQNDYRPVLVDWRAPLARPYYLATTAQPEGVWRRRTLHTVGKRLTHFSDEFLMPQEPPEGYPAPHTEAGGVVSESALLQALNAPRTRHMSDIVATIQREQDTIIRCDHRGVVVVEGGPGTGKTAVALHRAAYLLYTYRSILERSGVLIVGPNRSFLNYINQVLPSLGETGVVLTTIGSIYPGIETATEDTLHAQSLKGSLTMVDILKAAIRDWQTLIPKRVMIRVEGTPFDVTPKMVRKARARARSSRRPHNRARQVFHDTLTQEIVDAYAAEIGSDPLTPNSAGSLLSRSDISDLTDEILHSAEVHHIVDTHWPILRAEDIVERLFSDKDHLQRVAKKYLSKDDIAELIRDDGTAFTVSDIPLLDEAAELLGIPPRVGGTQQKTHQWQQIVEDAQDALDILKASASMEFEDESDTEILAAYDIIDAQRLAQRYTKQKYLTTAERAVQDREWSYGHIIVDEAQELSPMAWRLLMRRAGNRWMTIVGDTGQTSNPAGVTDWAEMLTPYVQDRWRHYSLTVNYRTPKEIMDVAQNVLHSIDPDATVPESIRHTDLPVHKLNKHNDSWKNTVLSGLTNFAKLSEAETRTCGIICSRTTYADISSDFTTPPSFPTPAIVRVADIKGLEFDYVLIVDPEGIITDSPRGLNDLYVALTRATQAATIIYAETLPTCLTNLVPVITK